ncbi:LAMI_0D06370g1_1 [Lachancea mirantina]|uniref:Protein HIR n=1 Tax=Lachancea mirantina TaxID=1230905 RepID=A0A1G4JBP0_9SACH|nr:LAMI_0D06370g1_1 [Lachancea mirantina]
MKILKLPWLVHKEEHRKYEVYASDVSPDKLRLATGGLDGKVRIWSVPDIVKYGATPVPNDEESRKPLASMSRHTGSVTVVKFSPDGKLLASGSDDRILLIWEREDNQNQPVFGSENDREHWNVRRRLVAHDNDIQDMCWAPDASILVTVGLDRSIIVWNGSTFEKIKRFDVHQSHIKGVIFDPANKYFATASDDRTVSIFRYHKAGDTSFTIEHVVSDPFKGSPLTTYFRRLSWSPDGQHIAVPNATNGPVTSVAIISRGTWDSNVSLIGHVSPTEVARFSPRLYKSQQAEKEAAHVDEGNEELNAEIATDSKEPRRSEFNGETTRVDSVLATAGQDKTLCIWSTAKSRPLLVLYDITNKSITDMGWSPDGQLLFLSSLDGSITVLMFEEGELGDAIPLEKNIEHLYKYGVDKDSLDFPESVKQLDLEAVALKLRQSDSLLIARSAIFELPEVAQAPEVTQVENEALIRPPSVAVATASNNDTAEAEQLNKTTVKNGRKRVAPTLISSGQSPKRPKSAFIPNKVPVNKVRTPELGQKGAVASYKLSKASYPMPRLGIHSLIMGVRERNAEKFYKEKEPGTSDLDADVVGDSEGQDDTELTLTLNAKTTADRVWSCDPGIRYVEVPSVVPDADAALVEFGDFDDLYILEIRNGVERSLQFDTEALFENPTKLLGYHKGERILTVFLPEIVLCAIGLAKSKLWAVATATGSIFIYSTYGRALFPKICLGHKVIKLASIDNYLIALTETGLLFSWNVNTGRSLHKNVSILPILCTDPVDSHRVRIFKKLSYLTLSMPELCLKVNLTNPQSSYCWLAHLGCWTQADD